MLNEDQPIELLDEDLDTVAGGSFTFDIEFNNTVSNQGVQLFSVEFGSLTF
jgi:hypothetical protein